jgi:hypothetical protein
MLILRLPFQSVSDLGFFWTFLFFVLDPPFFFIQALVPQGAHDLETSIWPQLEYPVAAITAVAWWLLVGFLWGRRNRQSGDEQQAA